AGPPKDLVTSEVTNTSFRASWTPAPGNVQAYQVYWKSLFSEEHGEKTVPGDATSTILEGLTSETPYQVTVIATYSYKDSDPLTGLETTDGNVINYRLKYIPTDGGKEVVLKIPGTTTSTIMKRLQPITTYNITVLPIYKRGEGKPRQGVGTTPFTSVSADNQCRTSAKADIVLLVDGSWSIGRINFKTIRNFIARMVGVFDIGPNNVQIALAQYSGDPRTEWHLNTHSTRDSLLKAINDLPYILQNNFQPAVGLRSDSRKIGVLITDGKSQDEIIIKSQNLRDSVKNADENELRSIASDPDEIHMYNVADFKFLLDIVDDLSGNLCNSVKGSGRSGHNKAAPPD
ncbi:hypothetical protein GOODEAATRI_011373, partial [Goodea atripinnis]